MRERKKRETSFIILKLDDDDDDRNDITINEILSTFCLVCDSLFPRLNA